MCATCSTCTPAEEVVIACGTSSDTVRWCFCARLLFSSLSVPFLPWTSPPVQPSLLHARAASAAPGLRAQELWFPCAPHGATELYPARYKAGTCVGVRASLSRHRQHSGLCNCAGLCLLSTRTSTFAAQLLSSKWVTNDASYPSLFQQGNYFNDGASCWAAATFRLRPVFDMSTLSTPKHTPAHAPLSSLTQLNPITLI